MASNASTPDKNRRKRAAAADAAAPAAAPMESASSATVAAAPAAPMSPPVSSPSEAQATPRQNAASYQPVFGRIPILELRPQVPDGLFAAKAYQGEVVPFSCVSFREGHDLISVDLVIEAADGSRQRVRMRPGAPGLDQWVAIAQVSEIGDHHWHIESWADDFATWRHNAEVKVAAGVDEELMLEEGARLLERALTDEGLDAHEREVLADAIAAARSDARSIQVRLASLFGDDVATVIDAHPLRSLVTHSAEQTLQVERLRAGFGAWYEFFPRSEGAAPIGSGQWRSGTFRTAMTRLDEVAQLGFDVVYLPPIHPIGLTNRKGPNNTLVAGPNDPGSPWAIGGEHGGHREIHPDLGTVDDFVAFRQHCDDLGMELALDLALQATPDHPWVKAHPEWFTTLADGTIAYAENPPKKYQDIYPLNFDNDPEGLYAEVLETVEYWISLGVNIFRVDNPHTKPLQFWEWLIHTINERHPQVLFLAEAFTRPAIMHSLAMAGFQQSYSYFAWRNTRDELEEFLSEVSHDSSAFMRPNLFVNTPDILTEYLQRGGRAAYVVRAVIAAMAAPNWGMYAGFELIENQARPGSEENLDNEKYQFKQRDWAAAEREGRSIAPIIRKLNAVRHTHPALAQQRNFQVQYPDNPQVFAFSKHLDGAFTADGKSDTVIVVVNLDPLAEQEATVYLDLAALGLPEGQPFEVEEQLSGEHWWWAGANYVRLHPTMPAHVLTVCRH